MAAAAANEDSEVKKKKGYSKEEGWGWGKRNGVHLASGGCSTA